MENDGCVVLKRLSLSKSSAPEKAPLSRFRAPHRPKSRQVRRRTRRRSGLTPPVADVPAAAPHSGGHRACRQPRSRVASSPNPNLLSPNSDAAASARATAQKRERGQCSGDEGAPRRGEGSCGRSHAQEAGGDPSGNSRWKSRRRLRLGPYRLRARTDAAMSRMATASRPPTAFRAASAGSGACRKFCGRTADSLRRNSWN